MTLPFTGVPAATIVLPPTTASLVTVPLNNSPFLAIAELSELPIRTSICVEVVRPLIALLSAAATVITNEAVAMNGLSLSVFIGSTLFDNSLCTSNQRKEREVHEREGPCSSAAVL